MNGGCARRSLGTVEVNRIFYRTPSVSKVNGWYVKTPPDFVRGVQCEQVRGHVRVRHFAPKDSSPRRQVKTESREIRLESESCR